MTDNKQIIEIAKLDKWEVTSRTLVLSGGMDEEGSGKTVLHDYVLKHNSKFVEAFDWNLNSVPTLNDCLQTIIARTPYLTSRDAIVPVVLKQSPEVQRKFYALAPNKPWLELTVPEIAQTLLRATGKWRDEPKGDL